MTSAAIPLQRASTPSTAIPRAMTTKRKLMETRSPRNRPASAPARRGDFPPQVERHSSEQEENRRAGRARGRRSPRNGGWGPSSPSAGMVAPDIAKLTFAPAWQPGWPHVFAAFARSSAPRGCPGRERRGGRRQSVQIATFRLPNRSRALPWKLSSIGGDGVRVHAVLGHTVRLPVAVAAERDFAGARPLAGVHDRMRVPPP